MFGDNARAVSLLLLTVFTALVLCGTAQAAIVTVPESWTASGIWVDTGLVVAKGDTIRVIASGTVTSGGNSPCTADGYGDQFKWPDQWLNPNSLGDMSPDPAAGGAAAIIDHQHALIGYVGPSPLPPALFGNVPYEAKCAYVKSMVLLGSSVRAVAPASGKFWLGVNCGAAYSGNLTLDKGQFSARVSVRPAPTTGLPAALISQMGKAVTAGDAAKVNTLLKQNPLLLNAPEKDGSTPLHLAAGSKNAEIVKFLIDTGADVDVPKKNGVTPLHIAASLGRLDTAQLLIQSGADVSAKDDQGRTPLSLAQAKNNVEIAAILAGAGGSLSTNTKGGDAPKAQPASGSIKVELAADEPFTIFRQGKSGWERQVVLHINNSGPAFEPGSLVAKTPKGAVECSLEPIPEGESFDVIWVPGYDTPATIDLVLSHAGAPLFQGQLQLPQVPVDQVVAVPASRILTQIPPLAIRGTNYMPKDHPWPGLPRDASLLDFGDDFTLMNWMGINTIRTFTFFDPDPPGITLGMYRKDGCATTKAQKHVIDLVTMADRHHIKVILLPPGDPAHQDIPSGRKCTKTILGPFVNDGRLLMVDVANELDSWEGKDWDKAAAWLKVMYPYVRKTVPNHLLTVGLAYKFKKLFDLGIYPDVAQYHDYSGGVGKPVPGQPGVRNVSEDLAVDKGIVGNRPLLIGEFGQSTNDKAGGVTEERQRAIYQGVLEGAEDQRILGVMNWQMFDMVPGWMGAKEQVYGCVRGDGTLKPSGELLRAMYLRWAAALPAPWDAR